MFLTNLKNMILQKRNTAMWFLSVLLLLNIIYYVIFKIVKLQKSGLLV